jgi:RNA polymerase sigma factor (sigma-70 family)
MAEPQADFKTLMERLKNGDETAAQQLVDVYGETIIRVVRRKLNQKLRTLFDSIDFTQAVWASFFAFAPDRYQFDSPQKLIAFLTSLAQNKVVEAVRNRLVYEKRNLNRQRSLEDLSEDPCGALHAPGPGPDEIAIAREEWQKLLDGQPENRQRMLHLLRDGRTRRAVAEELCLTERTIRRIIQKLSPGQFDERD